jgi:hypothetical protein
MSIYSDRLRQAQLEIRSPGTSVISGVLMVGSYDYGLVPLSVLAVFSSTTEASP